MGVLCNLECRDKEQEEFGKRASMTYINTLNVSTSSLAGLA